MRALLPSTAPTRAAPPLFSRAPAPSGAALTAESVLSQLAAHRPVDSIIVEEATSYRSAMHDHVPITQPDSFLTTASGGLGHVLPAAIGVALGTPGQGVSSVRVADVGALADALDDSFANPLPTLIEVLLDE